MFIMFVCCFSLLFALQRYDVFKYLANKKVKIFALLTFFKIYSFFAFLCALYIYIIIYNV